MNEHELMAEMKVSKAVAKMAVPSVVSSLVTVIYNMADTFFVGQTGDALQVAAVSLTNPIFILLMAFANMLGMGGSAVASVALGKKKEKRVKKRHIVCIFCVAGCGRGLHDPAACFHAPYTDSVRRQCRDLRLCAGIYAAHFLRRAVYHLVRGLQFHTPRGGSQQGGHDWKYDRNHRQHRAGPDFYLRAWYGRGGRRHCYYHRKCTGPACIISGIS